MKKKKHTHTLIFCLETSEVGADWGVRHEDTYVDTNN